MNVFLKLKQNWLVYLTSCLVAIFIITLPGYTDLAKKAFYLLALLSLGYLVFNFNELKQLDNVIKLFFIVIVGHFLWTVTTFYMNGSPGRGSTFIWGRQVYMVFIVPLYILFRNVNIPQRLVWSSIAASIVLSLFIGYQDIQLPDGRAQGGMHPILFGSILLCMAMYMIVYAMKCKSNWLRLTSVALFLTAMVLVIWSQSRGVWAAAPVLLLVIGFFYMRGMSVKLRLIAVSVLVVSISVISQLSIVKNKINTTIVNIKGYSESTTINDWSRGTSIGTRLEMWKAAWQIFLDYPLTGVGLGGYDKVAKKNADKYRINRSAYWFYHPHNQYLSSLSTRGLPGLIFLLLLMTIPAYYSWKYISRNKKTGVDHYANTMTVIIISTAFGIFGLSDVPFEGKATILFYVLFISMLLGMQPGARQDKLVKSR